MWVHRCPVITDLSASAASEIKYRMLAIKVLKQLVEGCVEEINTAERAYMVGSSPFRDSGVSATWDR